MINHKYRIDIYSLNPCSLDMICLQEECLHQGSRGRKGAAQGMHLECLKE